MPDRIPDVIATQRLVLTALEPDDARRMVEVLADPALYAFTGGEPPSLAVLQARYRAQVAGSPDPGERWRNWIVALAGTEDAVGFVQATLTGDTAEVAWVIGTAWQGRGYAREAAAAMIRGLADGGVVRLSAHIHPDHAASAAVARAVGLRPTDEVDDDGEQVWRG